MTNSCFQTRSPRFIAAKTKRSAAGMLVLSLLLVSDTAIAQHYIELSAEIEINDWSYWFFEDENGLSALNGAPKSIFTKLATVHCVVGTNTWMMEGRFRRNANVTRWFNGTNIMERGVITEGIPVATMKRFSEFTGIAERAYGAGEQFTREYETSDGNPGRPMRVTDLMDLQGRICWLAFCSGSALKQEGRRLFPPSDLWKELVAAPSGFIDKVSVFDDGLDLPKSIELFTPQEQLIFQYQVRQSTNVLGWNFPLEFYLVQYRPARLRTKTSPDQLHANSWELQLTAKGRVTSIKEGNASEIPDGPSK